jgi:hypothetical protein
MLLVLAALVIAEGKESESPTKHIVLLISRLGLANRLRSMADWHQIAMESGRELIVSWEPTYDCNVAFHDLFQGAPKGLIVLDQPLAMGPGRLEDAIMAARTQAEEYGKSFKVLARGEDGSSDLIQDGFDTFIVSRRAVFDETDVLFTNHDGLVALAGVPCQRYRQARSDFYTALKPVEDIGEYVDVLHAKYFRGKVMVGVHIRHHDPRYDWSVVPPGGGTVDTDVDEEEEDVEAALNFGTGATPAMFQRAMRAIDAQFRSRFGHPDLSTPRLQSGSVEEDGEVGSPVRFFIASNDQSTKDFFIEHFPAAVALSGAPTVDESLHSRSLPESVRFAFVEWLLLSRASLILHTYGSSFAEEAAARNRVPLVGVWSGINILHHYDALPHCGYSQFMRAYAQQGWDGFLTEELHYSTTTHEDERERTVTGRSFLVLPCPMLSDWDIPDLYCFQDDKTVAAMGLK